MGKLIDLTGLQHYHKHLTKDVLSGYVTSTGLATAITSLGNVLQFAGTTDGKPNYDSDEHKNGMVKIDASTGREYVCYDSNWIELGDESSFVVKNAPISEGTAYKVTYDAQGLVIEGVDHLEEDDIPSLASNKITALTGYKLQSSAATAIAEGDKLNEALSKLEKGIAEAKSNAGVTSFGTKKGAITVRGGQTGEGDVNLAMSNNELQASIVGLKSAAFTESSAYATAAQGTKADTALQSAVTTLDGKKGALTVTKGSTNLGDVNFAVSEDGGVLSGSVVGLGKEVPSDAVFTDTDTTYTFAEGSTKGAFSVTPSGGSAQSVKVHGLASAAYTESTAYATAEQGTKADNALPASSYPGIATATEIDNAFGWEDPQS